MFSLPLCDMQSGFFVAWDVKYRKVLVAQMDIYDIHYSTLVK